MVAPNPDSKPDLPSGHCLILEAHPPHRCFDPDGTLWCTGELIRDIGEWRRTRDQASEDQQCRTCRRDLADDCGHHSWAGLMALLDEHWPEDIFPTREDDIARDAGARIVSLIRWVDRLRGDAR